MRKDWHIFPYKGYQKGKIDKSKRHTSWIRSVAEVNLIQESLPLKKT